MVNDKIAKSERAIEQARELTAAPSAPSFAPSTSRPIHSVAALGELVANRRKARNFTQQEFADLAGVGRRFLSELESGKATAETGKVLQVLNALGLDLIVRER